MSYHAKRFMMAAGCLAVALTLNYRVVAQQAADPYKEAIKYDFGQSRAVLTQIEDDIRKGGPSQYKVAEAKLLDILKAPEATFAAKQFACRQLRQVGSAQCIPTVAALLTDEKLSHMARYALQGLPFPQVDDALRDALPKVSGALKIGIVGTIAQRGDEKAVGQIAALVTDKDEALAGAALSALGRIGGKQAAQVLTQATVPGALQNKRADALLMCADKFMTDKDTSSAEKIYRDLYAKTNPTHIRVGALRGLTMTGREKSVPMLLELLTDADTGLRAAAGRFLVDVPGTASTKAIAVKLVGLSPEAQAAALNALGDRGDKSVAGEVGAMVSSQNPAVRVAALRAIGSLGDRTSVDVLLKAATGSDDAAQVAADSMNRLSAPGVDDALLTKFQNADAAGRTVLIRAFVVRTTTAAVPALLQAAQGPDAGVQKEAHKALGALVDDKSLSSLVQLVVKSNGSGESEGAVSDAVRRISDQAKCSEPMLAALPGAGVPARCALLRLLGQVGGEKALGAVRAAAIDSDETVQDAAIRSLTGWSDISPAADLLNIARSAMKDTHKILALRGYVRLVGVDSKRPAGEVIKSLAEALPVAARPDEKKLVIGALANTGSSAALKVLEPLMADEALSTEVGSAYLKIADILKQKKKAEAKATLQKLLELSKNEAIRTKATKALEALK